MTTEELNTIIAKAEGGDVAAMNTLTHIYGEVEGFINYEEAARWFLALILKDCDPNSGVYEKTGYNKVLYEKTKNAILNSATEGDILSQLSGDSYGGSLLGSSMTFTTFTAKSYIEQIELAIKQNIVYKEELRQKAIRDETLKRIEEEKKRKAEAEEERIRQAAEAARKRSEEEKKRKAEEKALKEAERERKRKAEAEKKRRAEASARMKVVAEERKAARMKEIGALLKEYCLENADSISIEWKRFDEHPDIGPREMLAFLQLQNGEQYLIQTNDCEFIIKLAIKEKIGSYVSTEVRIKKHYLDVSLQRKAEENALLSRQRKQIETDQTYSSCFKDVVGKFTIPSETTRIGNRAFFKCVKLREIIIPESVSSVGNEAFSGCERLESIQLSKDVSRVGSAAFYGCNELASIKLGESLTKIEDYTFAYCHSLKSVVLPTSVTSIGNNAFDHCCNMETITLPPYTEFIGDGAFNGCDKLKEIIVPKGEAEHFSNLLKYCCAGSARIVEKKYSDSNNVIEDNPTGHKKENFFSTLRNFFS